MGATSVCSLSISSSAFLQSNLSHHFPHDKTWRGYFLGAGWPVNSWRLSALSGPREQIDPSEALNRRGLGQTCSWIPGAAGTKRETSVGVRQAAPPKPVRLSNNKNTASWFQNSETTQLVNYFLSSVTAAESHSAPACTTGSQRWDAAAVLSVKPQDPLPQPFIRRFNPESFRRRTVPHLWHSEDAVVLLWGCQQSFLVTVLWGMGC